MCSQKSLRSFVLRVGIGIALFAAPALAIDLTEIARFNLDSTADAMNPEFVGSNASAVAWSGSRLYVGGFNNAGGFVDIGIVEVLGAGALGIVETPTFTRVDTLAFTPASRGISGMDFSADGGSISVAYDDGIAGTPNGFAVYDTASNTRRWGADVRGSSGTAFDPGFQGVGAGTGFGAFGSGRVQLYDTTTGANLADATNGDIWFLNTPGVGTFTRDLDFDPVTGDIYARHSNNVSHAVRTGADSTNPQGVISTVPQADFVGIQNLSFMRYPEGGSESTAVIFNNREFAAVGQPFIGSIRVIDTVGGDLTPTFTFLDGLPPLDGSASYDFDYDFDTNTLAMLDFGNRNVHIFQVGSGTSGAVCDINGDSICDSADLRLVYDDISLAVAGGPADIDGSGTVDNADIPAWLAAAGSENGVTYRPGDANLDGSVGGGDFTTLASNFGASGLPGAYWDQGNFDGNEGGTFAVGGGDFTALASNFGASSIAAVPEGDANLWLLPLLATFLAARRSRR